MEIRSSLRSHEVFQATFILKLDSHVVTTESKQHRHQCFFVLCSLVFGRATCYRAYVSTHRQDVLVLGTSALQPGSIVEIRALGYMVMGERVCNGFGIYSPFDPKWLVPALTYTGCWSLPHRRVNGSRPNRHQPAPNDLCLLLSCCRWSLSCCR